jgi:hypothetical protein
MEEGKDKNAGHIGREDGSESPEKDRLKMVYMIVLADYWAFCALLTLPCEEGYSNGKPFVRFAAARIGCSKPRIA